MRRLFADTFYWIALFNPRDAWHERVLAFSQAVGPWHLTTTEEVLSEFLTFYGAAGPQTRQQAAALARSLFADPTVTVIRQSHASFLQALALYEARRDKHYSLTDCGSMVTMRRRRLSEVLTNDRHFSQEGFQILFQENAALTG
jgi:predicted nucleic acid-binding protein